MATYQILLWALLGLMLLPIGLRLLHHVIPIIRSNLESAMNWMTIVSRRGFERSAVLITDGGSLSPPQAVSQTMGAIFLVAAGTIFAICDLQLTFATFTQSRKHAIIDNKAGSAVQLLKNLFGLSFANLLQCH